MPMMPYVSPEQAMKDKADFARKGISRGRSAVAVVTADGVLFVAENPSTTLHKVSEIYDRIAFAAVGKYNEFEQLRVAGIRLADVRGYQYSREDVTGRALATAYSNALGSVFTDSPKPLEVELLVAEVIGDAVELYHILYDGSITDEEGFVAIGGSAEAINEALSASFEPGMDRGTALRTTVRALGQVEERDMAPSRLEVAGLDRSLGRRKFFRLTEDEVTALLEAG
ncbi:proteasome subunit alpha [Euzebya sp.]|uniref:proteasome subunit alpha n=1 Tax=Euzebya sp. TaxID=1971409 RepID=UPI0035183985